MTKAKITFEIEVEETFLEELKRQVDHHIDYLINTTEYPEIKAIYNATLVTEDQHRNVASPF